MRDARSETAAPRTSPDDAGGSGLLVEVRGLRRVFGRGSGEVVALDGVDLDLAEGEYVAIQGTSGSGKSTLLQIIGFLDRASAGELHYRGNDVRGLSDRELTRLRNEEVGFVFQSFQLLSDRTARENVRLPLDYRKAGRGDPHDPDAMLERVGLGNRLDHRPGELSGGERQRVAIARALVKRPHLILLDEPTGNLDSRTSGEILDLLDSIHDRERATLLLVTHNAAVAARAHRVLTLADGRWVS